MAKEKLNEYTKNLELNLNRGNCCKDTSYKSGLSICELKYEMNKCQVTLLDNKEYKFNSISTIDSVFGDLVTNDVEIIDESRLEGTMRFEIKDFSSKFRYTFSKPHFINQWLFGVEMKEIDNDIYLYIFHQPRTCQTIFRI